MIYREEDKNLHMSPSAMNIKIKQKDSFFSFNDVIVFKTRNKQLIWIAKYMYINICPCVSMK